MPTSTPVASSRGEASFNRSRTGLFPMILPTLRHGDHAHKHLKGIPAWRRGSSDRSSARLSCPQVPQWHPRVAKERKSVPLTGLRSGLRLGLARLPCPQVLQWHPRVAKGACGRSSARGPCPQVPQCHLRVAKGASDRSSARGPCPQVPQGHPRVAKGRKSVPLTGLRSSLQPGSARQPCPQVPQCHPRGATVSWLSDSSRIGLREIHLARAVIDYQVVSD